MDPQFRRMATQKMANCWRSPLFPFGKWFLDLAFSNKWQSTNGQLLEMLYTLIKRYFDASPQVLPPLLQACSYGRSTKILVLKLVQPQAAAEK